MKNVNQQLVIENGRACRAKAMALRNEVAEYPAGAAVAKLLAIARQWDDLAEEYEISVLRWVA